MAKLKARTSAPISLPVEAFRLSMLDGTLEPSQGAGADNIPPVSQEIPACEPSTAGVDYLTLMYETGTDIDSEIEVWEQLLEVRFDTQYRVILEKDYGCFSLVRGSCGSSFEYKYTPDGQVSVRVSGGGQVFGHLSSSSLRKVYGHFLTLDGARCTRIDIKMDDSRGILELNQIEESLRMGNYHGFLGGEIIESVGGRTAGKTIYFGGRKSITRMRFYDKAAQAGIETPLVRQELQCRSARANELWHYIMREDRDIWEQIGSRLVSSITFGVLRDKNLNRTVVAAFWTEWREYVGVTREKPPSIPRVTSLHRTLTWMRRSVSKAMAKAKAAFSPKGFADFLQILVTAGDSALGVKEWDEVMKFIEQGDEAHLLAEVVYNT